MLENEKDIYKAKNELINLCIGLKVRKEKEVTLFKYYIYYILFSQVLEISEDQINSEINTLQKTSLKDLVEYVKDSIDIIVSIHVDEKTEQFKSSLNEDENAATSYQILLRKEESAIRQHIAYEHQLKIECEKLIDEVESLKFENKTLSEEVNAYSNSYKNYVKKYEKLKNDYNSYKEEKKKYLKTISALKTQLNIKEKEMIRLQTQMRYYEKSKNKDFHIRNHRSNLSVDSSNNKGNSIKKTSTNSAFLTVNNRKSIENYHNNNINYNSNSKNYFNKNKSMSNINPARNNNYFTNINRNSEKEIKLKNKLNNSEINIKNQNVSAIIPKDSKLSTLNISNNDLNMGKNNNVVINVNSNIINTNINVEKIKVQQKLIEYRKLIDKKLNDLLKNKTNFIKKNQNFANIRRNSSPNFHCHNSHKKNKDFNENKLQGHSSKKRKNITPVTGMRKSNNDINNTVKFRKFVTKRQKSKSKNSNEYNSNKGTFYMEESYNNNNNKNDLSGIVRKGGNNISLRKFIFAKSGNGNVYTNTINPKY